MTDLSAADRDSLRCLFFNGPTWDGDVPSKLGRSELVRMGLAERYEGYNWLTRAGVQHCLSIGLDREKDRWQRQRREATAAPKPPKIVLVTRGLPASGGAQHET